MPAAEHQAVNCPGGTNVLERIPLEQQDISDPAGRNRAEVRGLSEKRRSIHNRRGQGLLRCQPVADEGGLEPHVPGAVGVESGSFLTDRAHQAAPR